jgi:hypothetical protein
MKFFVTILVTLIAIYLYSTGLSSDTTFKSTDIPQAAVEVVEVVEETRVMLSPKASAVDPIKNIDSCLKKLTETDSAEFLKVKKEAIAQQFFNELPKEIKTPNVLGIIADKTCPPKT